MPRKEDDLEKKYAKILESRQKNVDRNLLEGRNLGVTAIPEASTEGKRAVDELYDRMLEKRQNKLMKNAEMGRSIDLAGTLPIAEAKGSKISNLSNEIKTDFGDNPAIKRDIAFSSKSSPVKDATEEAVREANGILSGKMGKTLKALGILAPGIAAMGIGEKAMAGDFGSAGMDTADLATDYVPVVGQIKDAIRPEEIGNQELPANEMAMRAIYNEQMRRNKEGQAAIQPAFKDEPLPERVKKEDLDKLTSKFQLLNKMK
jgi:hypothetical protein